MTCNEVAEVFENVVAERRARSKVKPAMRYRQMERIAKRLREHGDEDRFDENTRDMLPKLDALQLLSIEFTMMEWWKS